jgi:hypothetical protein
MRVVISACTHKAFLHGPMPLAHLKRRPIGALNDNDAQSPFALRLNPSKHPRSVFALRPERTAFGRAELIVAVVTLVVGILAGPLLQGFSAPVITARQGMPEVLRGSPVAPALLQAQENG